MPSFWSSWQQLGLLASCTVTFLLLYTYFDSQLTAIRRAHEDNGQIAVQQPRDSPFSSDSTLGSNVRGRTAARWNEEELIVIYNRIPKTASTSFMAGVAYELCKANNFYAIHLNTSKNTPLLSITDQLRFIKNITRWTAKKPAIYHGHVAFIDFLKFGVSNPIYVNVVRDPLQRLVSYYYFLRFGDDYRPEKVRRKQGDTETFDQCVERNGVDCSAKHLWMQVPFFCGQSAECWKLGSRWALEQAKRNLVDHYLVVGLTEELGDFVAVLQFVLPRFFRGAYEKFMSSGDEVHRRKTNYKLDPSPETIRKVQTWDVWKVEQEFYEFAREQFEFVKERVLSFDEQGIPIAKKSQFHYEKIRPQLQ